MPLPLYKSACVNLNDDLLAESERKLAAWREDQREGDLLYTSTSTEVSITMVGMVMRDNAILKIIGDPAKCLKDAINLNFPSGNQSDEDNAYISKSDAGTHTILQLSKENSRKLLF
jgi:hypothetical protein